MGEKKAEEERLAAEKKAEEERLAAEEKAKEEKLAAEKKAEEDRIAAEKKAEEERIAAEKKAEEERIAAIKKNEERVNSYATMTPDDRAWSILYDLGAIEMTPDPDSTDYDSSKDDEYCDENVYVNFERTLD